MRRTIPAIALLVGAIIIALSRALGDPTLGLRWAVAASLAALALTLVSRARLRDAALLATSLALGLTTLEAIALYREAPAATWIDSGLRRPRPYVGFGPTRPGTYAMKEIAPGGRVVFDVTATIGDDLLRVAQAPRGEGAIAFFGDSFTFGAGLNDADTITQSFADLTARSVPVPNLAFSAWSPAQNLATLQHGINADALHHPRRFVLMTGAWHIERTACKVEFVRGAPRYRLRGGALVEDGACFEPAGLHRVLTSFAIYRDAIAPLVNRLTKRDVETYDAIVDAFVKTAKRSYGVDTTIIALPYLPGQLERIGSSEADYLAALRRTGADVLVDPLPATPDNNPYVIPGDFHPSGLANRTMAKLLRDHLEAIQPGLLPRTNTATP